MRTRLKENESVLFTTRPHWYFLLFPFLISIVILIASLILYADVGYPFLILLIIITGISLFLAFKYYERMLDIWVVTTLRLIDESGVFTVRVKESPLDKINNVSYSQSLLGRMLGFGDVEIQTAAEMGATIYKGLGSPKELNSALTSAQENYKQNLVFGQAFKINQTVGKNLSTDTIECPFCAEIIKAKAKFCRYCGKELNDLNK
ncbi:MAG: hypothetical protein C0412_11670 [Flavobacterium sp.]|nr:hypothetical protein [Flavobacterium sp.]